MVRPNRIHGVGVEKIRGEHDARRPFARVIQIELIARETTKILQHPDVIEKFRQVGLVVVVARLAWSWWQRRNGSEPATAAGPSYRQGLNGGHDQPSPMLGGLFGGGSAANAQPQQPAGEPIELQPDDFNAFEKLLNEVQSAYGREDLSALRSRVTPEMLSYYSDELAHNASNGDVNQITDVKLLQGDLSEAWRENNDDYATVAMRYSLNDRIVARDGGKLIEQLPGEVTELWTFRRARGGQWLLSAVQQND